MKRANGSFRMRPGTARGDTPVSKSTTPSLVLMSQQAMGICTRASEYSP